MYFNEKGIDMSTSKRKKEARAKQLKREAELRKYEQERKLTKPRTREFVEYTLPDIVRRDEGVVYRSLNSSEYNTFKTEANRYTGTLVKGIATMHKSNAVPVLDDEHIIDIAHMRR